MVLLVWFAQNLEGLVSLCTMCKCSGPCLLDALEDLVFFFVCPKFTCMFFLFTFTFTPQDADSSPRRDGVESIKKIVVFVWGRYKKIYDVITSFTFTTFFEKMRLRHEFYCFLPPYCLATKFRTCWGTQFGQKGSPQRSASSTYY